MDIAKLPGVDYVHDANEVPWDFESETFDRVYASHFLEHVFDVNAVVKEIHRILKPDGVLEVIVPDYRSKGAYSDPDHKHFFTDETFDYWCDTDVGRDYRHTYPLLFEKETVEERRAWRFGYHLEKYLPSLAPRLLRIVGRPSEFYFRLRKV